KKTNSNSFVTHEKFMLPKFYNEQGENSFMNLINFPY
ncbi:unnamed protein product, partial [Brassica rapa subsp. trilocularis]